MSVLLDSLSYKSQAHYSENTKWGMWPDSQYLWAQITVEVF